MVLESQGSESTGSQGSDGAETSSPESTSSQSAGSETTDDGKAAPVQQAYTPNFKFKVMNQEKEMDPWLRNAIKDPDTEKKARELYEKAHGLDFVKNERQKYKEELQTVRTSANEDRQMIETANTYLAKNDYDSFFRFLNIKDDQIFQYALQKLKAMETPESKAAYERDVQARQQAYDLEAHNRQLSQSYESVAVEARTNEMNWALQRPELAAAESAFDQRYGKPGSFRSAVIERGKYHFLSSGRDISVQEAVNEVIQLAGLSQLPGQSGAAPQNGQAPVIPAQRPPVIPNISGKGTSPVKKQMKSLDDIKKRRLELEAQN